MSMPIDTPNDNASQTPEPAAQTPVVIAPQAMESGMRTGQGDENNDADSLTIADKYGDEAPDAPQNPAETVEAVHDAAAALGDPDYRPE